MAGFGGQVINNAAAIMYSRTSRLIFRRLQFNTIGRHREFSTSKLVPEDETDPAPLFFNNDVQQLLKTLTRADPKRVFRTRKDGKPVTDPVYKFMTNEELAAEMKKVQKKMEDELQMPPVVKKRSSITGILSKDPALQGYDTAKYVFTDITYGISHANRIVVVRDPNGLLRYADWDERFRMNQIYFPIEGRELSSPRMFQDEHLQNLIKREEYEFILNRACLQYDPDDPEFHRVTKTVYDNVNNSSHFTMLRSTRHYGPLVFHLVWNKNIDNLLLENLKNGLIEDAALLIQLYNKVNSTAKSAEIKRDGDDVKFIQQYADLESPIRGKLISAINAYKELMAAREVVEEGVKKAHGIK